MATRHNGELSHEYEDELLAELQGEGAAHEQMHHEDELGLHEDEFGFHENSMHEIHELGLGENGEGQAFFKKFRNIARGIGRFMSKASPVFRLIAKTALPLVAGAVGGPLGGVLGRVASQVLGEDELNLEDELAHEALHEEEFGAHEIGLHEAGSHEFELGSHEVHHEHGFAHEGLPELGGAHEGGAHEAHHESHHEVMAELMAEVAAGAQHEAEAEAMAGAAAVSVLTAADRAALRRLLPHLIRGVAVLTHILRRRRVTRPAVRTIPTIFRQTVRVLRERAAAGRPVSRRIAGQVMAGVARRMLSNPRLCGAAIVRNVRLTSGGRSVNG